MSQINEQTADYQLADLSPVLKGSNSGNTILESLPVWSSAQTRKSAGRGRSANNTLQYGVQKLRELILELAVRGKLVPQDPNEEPASILLEKIAKEKSSLFKDGKIKKQKILAISGSDKNLHKLPKGWSLDYLGNISHAITKGTTPTSIGYSFLSDGVSFIKVENIKNGRINLSTLSQFISDETHEALGRSKLETNDILFSIAGTIGKTAIVYETDLPANTNQALAIIKGTSTCFVPSYLKIQLDSFVSEAVRDKARGGAMPNISLGDLQHLVTLIPPLAEQQRIVKKVDELMALCDLLEQQQTDTVQAHDTVVNLLLDTLTQSENAKDFQQNWRRVAVHFDTLFTTESSIDQLKQTILQLAVRGKLVPQDPNDEPASILLEKIAEEKARLVAEGNIKKQKPLPEISSDQQINLLPTSWQNIRMDDICYGITSGSTPPKSEFTDGGIPYLKVYNIRNQKIDFDYQPQFIDDVYHKAKLKRSILYPGDVVMNIVGPPLGKTAIIPDTFSEWNCNQAIVFFRPLVGELSSYLHLFLKSGMFLNSIELIGTAGQDNISVTKSRSIVVSLPPLAEQNRIVKKVDELMALCGQLKERLNKAQTLQKKLADAVVQQAVQ